MVATSTARFSFPRSPSPAELIQQARELIFLGYATQSVATARTALETAVMLLACRDNIRCRGTGLRSWTMAVAKRLGFSKTRRRELGYMVMLLNAAAHGCPATTGDAVQVLMSVSLFVDELREGDTMTTKLPIDTKLAEILEQRFLPVVTRGKKPHTIARYRAAVERFSEYLQRPATLADLTDEVVSAFLMAFAERETVTSPRTVNNMMQYLRRFWTFCAKKRFADVEFPELAKLPEPEINPDAWSEDELRKLFASCDEEDRQVGRQPGWLYWRTLFLFVMDTGERSGALRLIEWRHLDFATAFVNVPAIIRKNEKAATYQLRPATIEGLQMMRKMDPEAVLMFGTIKAGTWFDRFDKILERAGLPTGRRNKTQKLRRTFATYLELCGHDASEALLHSERSTTVKSYLDASMLAKQKKYQHAPLPAGIVAEAEGMEFAEMIPVDEPENLIVPTTRIRMERGAL